MELKTLFLLLCFGLIQKFALAALGITQDVTAQNYFHWSGANAFNQDENTIRDALPSLARQAYEEMIDDTLDQGTRERDIPATMSALAIGSNVYFSSSLRGGMFLLNPKTGEAEPGVAEEVSLAIFRCQQTAQKTHRFELSCGEPLAIQQYLVNNKDASVIGRGRVSTYGQLDKNDLSNVGILNPCSVDSEGKWGCQVFIDKLQVTRVGEQRDQPGLPSIEPANELPHCFWSVPE